MHKVKLQGILIKFMEYGDTSLIYRFFTREHALIGVLAKGIRKKQEQQQLIPFNSYEINAYEPREAGLWLYSEAALLQDYSAFPSSATWAAAAAGMELISQIIIPHDEYMATYNLAISYLDYLKKTNHNAALIFWRFFLRITILSGIGNPLSACSLCHIDTNIYAAFLLSAGGFICPECLKDITQSDNLVQLSANSRKLLGLLPEIANHMAEIGLTRNDVNEINSCFEHYWLAHHKQPIKLKSLSVLAQFYPLSIK